MARTVPKHIRRLLAEQAAEAKPVAPQAPRKGKKIWPYAVGGAALTAGGVVALRSKPKAETVAKGLVSAPVSKASCSQDGTNVMRLQARTPDGRFVSHANDLSVTHVTPRRDPSSKLGVYGRNHGRRLS